MFFQIELTKVITREGYQEIASALNRAGIECGCTGNSDGTYSITVSKRDFDKAADLVTDMGFELL